MQALGVAHPLRPTYRTGERSVPHAFSVGEQDLRAAALDVRLVAIGSGEVRELRLPSSTRATDERAAVGAAIRIVAGLRPFSRALGTAEASTRRVETAPLDDPVLAAVRQDR